MNAVLPILFVSSYTYNKTRANTHATVIKLSFGYFFVVCDLKKWPNDNLITVACVFALVSLYRIVGFIARTLILRYEHFEH